MSELLDNLPPEWGFATLGEINTQKAPTLNPKNFPDESFEYYSIPDYQRDQRPSLTQGAEIESSKLLLEPNTVLFGKLNPRVEKVWRVGNESENRKIGSTEWIAVLPGENVDRDFLYFLEWSAYVMPIAKTLVSGSTPSRQRVDPKSFYSLRVPLPPLPEQKKIAHILSTVQRAIEAQERIIQTTTELKKALMHKLFTEGLRNEPQKQTEIGPVPESWEVVDLGEAMHLFAGYAFKSKESVPESNTQLLRMGNLYQNSLDLDRKPIFYPDSFAEDHSRFVLKEGDMVMSLTGTSGKEDYGFTVQIPRTEKTLLLNQRVARIEIIDDRLQKDFAHHLLLSRKFLDFLYPTAKGMKQANLSTNAMKKLKVVLPDAEEQAEIATCFKSLEQKVVVAGHKVAALQDLFRTLLHELMTAKIRVNGIELSPRES
jgi:type I restriction enzyme S subunit